MLYETQQEIKTVCRVFCFYLSHVPDVICQRLFRVIAVNDNMHTHVVHFKYSLSTFAHSRASRMRSALSDSMLVRKADFTARTGKLAQATSWYFAQA